LIFSFFSHFLQIYKQFFIKLEFPITMGGYHYKNKFYQYKIISLTYIFNVIISFAGKLKVITFLIFKFFFFFSFVLIFFSILNYRQDCNNNINNLVDKLTVIEFTPLTTILIIIFTAKSQFC
jgi:hypothetical protein